MQSIRSRLKGFMCVCLSTFSFFRIQIIIYFSQIPKVLVGNKTDLAWCRGEPLRNIEHLADQLDCEYFEISAKTNDQIMELSYYVVERYCSNTLQHVFSDWIRLANYDANRPIVADIDTSCILL